ncbi:hypothetical protein DUNSADRAFT_15949 [Dunaliella salina]|uniref:Uncharacterized protein n=1 Tax=Dunaliella salina TaxID=3046 RepID=A0ABQ7G4J0_DUNSA|nr:hypothetical protein DUNSADRAFT_15949 [Dunaliella salina]|eukprot:KAF5829531.1 hypothetical protein DUNSADRAFT_15949 [Dunaliella salina]
MMPTSSLYQPADIKGKVVLITGASAGFGEAFAYRFAELGCRLVLVARRMERLQALADSLHAKFGAVGCKCHPVCLDVRDIPACEALPSRLPAEFAQVDILINNAGLALGLAGVQDNSMQNMQIMLETNVLAVMALTKAFLSSSMLPRNEGHIINISSTAGQEAYPGGSGYNASKFALSGYSTAARHDLVGKNIRVTVISPGAVQTEFSLVRFNGDAERAASVYKGYDNLLAQDVADNVVYAATRPSRVQIAEITVTSVHQSGAKYTARPYLESQQQ